MRREILCFQYMNVKTNSTHTYINPVRHKHSTIGTWRVTHFWLWVNSDFFFGLQMSNLLTILTMFLQNIQCEGEGKSDLKSNQSFHVCCHILNTVLFRLKRRGSYSVPVKWGKASLMRGSVFQSGWGTSLPTYLPLHPVQHPNLP